MEFGEEVDDHLKREVMEEVGLKVRPGPPFYIWQWRLIRTGDEGEPLEIQIVAAARVCETDSSDVSAANRVEGDYLDDARWVDVNEVFQYDLIPNMVPAMRAFCDHVRRRRNGGAITSGDAFDGATSAAVYWKGASRHSVAHGVFEGVAVLQVGHAFVGIG